MTRTLQFLLAALAASLSVAACGSSGSTSSSSAPAPAPASATSVAGEQGAAVVKSASNAALGATVLVDSSGMTLYSLSGEGTAGSSAPARRASQPGTR
jgi:predicted lipoprotein with Yx(FWY)xxD motif